MITLQRVLSVVCSKPSTILLSALLFALLLASCGQKKDQEQTETAAVEEEPPKPMLVDKGFSTVHLDETANYMGLPKLMVTTIDNEEYLSYFQTKTIYIHNLESGKLINKVELEREGPNQVVYSLMINYFIHQLDSIFIETYSDVYYLVNDKAEVLKQIGTPSNTSFKRSSVSFNSASYFADNQIHGNIRMPFVGTPKETVYARASIKFQESLEVEKSIENELFINGYQELMNYRKKTELRNKRLDNMPRNFAFVGGHLYASTPISDSVYVFKDNQLIDSFYTGIPGIETASYEAFVNFRKSVHKPGEIRYESQIKRPPYYVTTLVDPKGAFVYRVLITSTKAAVSEYDGSEYPVVATAQLQAINTETKEIQSMDLSIDELEVRASYFNQVFVSDKGIHIRVKGQENEDQVLFKVFGFE